jgi:hypothetical protein
VPALPSVRWQRLNSAVEFAKMLRQALWYMKSPKFNWNLGENTSNSPQVQLEFNAALVQVDDSILTQQF